MAYVKVAVKKRKLLGWLRREHAPRYRVLVRIVPKRQLKDLGECSFDGRRFLILIRKQGYASWCDSLLHEWTHTRVWHGNDKQDHGPEWGLMYSELYTAWEAWMKRRPKRKTGHGL